MRECQSNKRLSFFMSNLKEIEERISKQITLNLEDRKFYFLMSCLSEIDLSYPAYKELIVLLSQSERLSKCIDSYLTNNSEVN